MAHERDPHGATVASVTQPNAFATGRNPQHAAIAVTVGLLRHLPPEQVKGVLAHEMAHIANRDILVSSFAATISGAIAAIANVLQFSLLVGGGENEDGGPLGWIGTIAAIVVAPLADALETLERGAQALPLNVNPAEASLYAVNPLPRGGLSSLS